MNGTMMRFSDNLWINSEAIAMVSTDNPVASVSTLGVRVYLMDGTIATLSDNEARGFLDWLQMNDDCSFNSDNEERV